MFIRNALAVGILTLFSMGTTAQTVEERLITLESGNAVQASNISSNRSDIDDLTDDVSELETFASTTSIRLDDMDAENATWRQTVNEHSLNILNLSNHVTALQDTGTTGTNYDAQIADLQSQIDNILQPNIDGNQGLIYDLYTQNSEQVRIADNRWNATIDMNNVTNDRIDAVDADLQVTKLQVQDNTDRLDDLSLDIDRVESESVARDAQLQDNIDQVEVESIARDEALNDKLVREVNQLQIVDAELAEEILIAQTEIGHNQTRISDTNKRIDLLTNQVVNNTNRIDNLEENVTHLRSEMYSAIAGSSAMAAIPDALPGGYSVGVGYGNFSGEDAAALGVSTRSSDGRHAFTFSGTITEQENGFAAGYSFSF